MTTSKQKKVHPPPKQNSRQEWMEVVELVDKEQYD
jgi:hypothetical protein